MKYPSLLRRYLASIIDFIIVLLFLMLYAHSPLHHEASNVEVAWPLLLFLVYEPVCNRYATTLGQALMRFRVRTMANLRRVPLWRGLIRVIAKYLLGVISFIKMPVHKDRRALHDIIAGTIAVESGSTPDGR